MTGDATTIGRCPASRATRRCARSRSRARSTAKPAAASAAISTPSSSASSVACGASTAATSTRARCCATLPHDGSARARGRRRGERRRRRHRRRLRHRDEGREPQPSQRGGAVPGCRDRRRAASCATSSPWVRGPSPCSTACASARSTRPVRGAWRRASSAASAGTATAWACPPSAARSGWTARTTATRSSTPCAWASSATRTSRAPVASGVGNPVILFGADTGRDGLHGATFASLEDPEATHRGVVQVGDPFMEKLLIEACLEVLRKPGLVGLQDLGATGLTSSTVEAAARGSGGIRIDVDRVPRRTAGPDALRGHAQREPGAHAGHRRARPRGRRSPTSSTAGACTRETIGEVTDDGTAGRCARATSPWPSCRSQMLVDAPTYRFPVERPDYLAEVQVLIADAVPLPADLTATFLELLASPNIASRGTGLPPLRPHGRHQHRDRARW